MHLANVESYNYSRISCICRVKSTENNIAGQYFAKKILKDSYLVKKLLWGLVSLTRAHSSLTCMTHERNEVFDGI
jgi:hypothetical protein